MAGSKNLEQSRRADDETWVIFGWLLGDLGERFWKKNLKMSVLKNVMY